MVHSSSALVSKERVFHAQVVPVAVLEEQGPPPPPPSPFDLLSDVWNLPTEAEQRARIGELFGLPDGPGVCIEALLLDELFDQLKFAKQLGLNRSQTQGVISSDLFGFS